MLEGKEFKDSERNRYKVERDKIVCGHVDLSQVDKRGKRGEGEKKGRKTLVLLAQRGY